MTLIKKIFSSYKENKEIRPIQPLKVDEDEYVIQSKKVAITQPKQNQVKKQKKSRVIEAPAGKS